MFSSPCKETPNPGGTTLLQRPPSHPSALHLCGSAFVDISQDGIRRCVLWDLQLPWAVSWVSPTVASVRVSPFSSDHSYSLCAKTSLCSLTLQFIGFELLFLRSCGCCFSACSGSDLALLCVEQNHWAQCCSFELVLCVPWLCMRLHSHQLCSRVLLKPIWSHFEACEPG